MIMRGCVLLEKSIHHRRRHRDTLGVVYIIIYGKVMSFDVYIYKQPTTGATVEVRGGGSTGRFIPSPRECCYCCCSDTAEKWGGKNHWTTSNALSNSWASAFPARNFSATFLPGLGLKLGVFTTVASDDLLFVYFLFLYVYNIYLLDFFFFFFGLGEMFFSLRTRRQLGI